MGYRRNISRLVAREVIFRDLFFLSNNLASVIGSQCLHSPVAPGFVTTYTGLVTVRAFLGLVEGPLVPDITLLLSIFYTRKELCFRYVAGLLFCRRPFLH